MSGSGVVREMTRSRMTEESYRRAMAALSNEQLTRERVDKLEEAVRAHGFLLTNDGNIYAKLSRGFWGRISWLLLGR